MLIPHDMSRTPRLIEGAQRAVRGGGHATDSGDQRERFAAMLLQSEAAASSKIENLTASAEAITKAELGQGTKNASIIVANQQAMSATVGLADRLDTDAGLAMHTPLLGASDRYRRVRHLQSKDFNLASEWLVCCSMVGPELITVDGQFGTIPRSAGRS